MEPLKNSPDKTKQSSGSKFKDSLGFLIQVICAFALVKTVGFFGFIASFSSYFWLKPKMGIFGALICSVSIGAAVGIGIMALFLDSGVSQKFDSNKISDSINKSPGIWIGSLIDTGEGIMEIKKSGSNYLISLQALASGCMGSIDGVGIISNSNFQLLKVDNENTCKVTAKISGDIAEVSQENCSYYHGASCSFSGIYRKKK